MICFSLARLLWSNPSGVFSTDIVFIPLLHVRKHHVELIKKKDFYRDMPLHDCNNGVIRFLISNKWASRHVKTSLVLTCGVHDVVYQVCEAGRGLVRQQVGEEIPGARQRQHSQTDRKTDTPHHIVPSEHDSSHRKRSIKMSYIFVHQFIQYTSRTKLFPAARL